MLDYSKSTIPKKQSSISYYAILVIPSTSNST